MDKIIFFTILVLFPFGQLFKVGFVNFFDIAVLLLAVATVIKKPKYPEWYKYFLYFLSFCLFSLIVNYKLFEVKSLLYLVRLWSYSIVAVYISNFFSKSKDVIRQLVAVTVVSAIFGWLQYLIWPDLTSLKVFGWDDHLLRMVGTSLDPTYLGLVLVLGVIVAAEKFPKVMYFLLFSLAFTYSRSSYLVASLFLLFKKKFVPLVLFIAVVFFLPKNIGEGTNFARTASGNQKLINYKETIEVFKRSPLIGVGFNSMCSARQNYLGDTNTNSHACNGADSSLLFILATAGIIGLILFLNFILQVPKSRLLATSLVAVLLHSLFANSLFYPHIMFWLFTLIGLETEVNRKRKN